MPERLTLTSDPSKWIDLKPVFTHGDKEDVHGYANLGVSDGGNTYQLNPVKYRTGIVAARVLRWNLAHEALRKSPSTGKLEVFEEPIAWDSQAPFQKRIGTLRAMDSDLVEEIYDVIRARIDAQDAAKAAATHYVSQLEAQAEKNDEPIGEIESVSNSPSPS